MQLIKALEESIIKHANRNAFLINEVFYTYYDLAKSISSIRKSIQTSINESDKNIGLVANDDLETYAAIVALWLEGKAYVPISTETPAYRNESIINQAGINTIIDSSEIPLFSKYVVIRSKKLTGTEINLTPKTILDEELSFILFTSGTTGTPKGVPITLANITGFIKSFFDLGYKFDENDKFLQMFEQTFDVSVMSYLIPLLKGACVYTIPKDKIKFSYIHGLLEDHNLTAILMVPSILFYLRPYFNEVYCESLKLSLFAGEALPLDITEEWSKCVPNARIVNAYGPTEDTILCTHYLFKRDGNNKSYNGILSIGQPMSGCDIIVVDENHKLLGVGEKGELCLGGVQLTPGYWNNEEKNKEAFYYLDYKGKSTRFYKTGDLCYIDEDGDIMFIGRIDFQAKIKGYRVELSEVEFHAKKALEKINVVAIAYINRIGETELGLVVESEDCNITEMLKYMKTKVPAYMIPAKTILIKEFPLNKNGKTDRKALELYFK